MDQLKLKYIIELVSNVGPAAQRDSKALVDAQKKVQEALADSNKQIGWMERALLKVGRVGSESASRQADYLTKLALKYHDVRRAADSAVTAMTKAARVGTQVVAGGAAGAYAADRVTKAPMEYSLRLAHMANTAFAGQGVAGRVSGKQMLDAAITAAVRTGGGKRDDAAGALDALIASGAVSVGDAVKLLPTLMRASTASGASAEQLGAIGLRGMQSFGLTRDQIPEVLNMAMAAGQAGGFELRDMAKWLPQLMAAGRQSGLSGMEGMRRILASAQASVITAGTKDEAGNNLVNLLAKINSKDTATDFKKLGYDLPAELARARGKGINSLDAFVGFVDELASKDKDYTALKAKLANGGTTGEKAATMAAMADILQGKAVGTVIQDRQALMALVAEMNNRGYIKNVIDQTRTNTGAIGTSFDVISQEAAFKKEQAGNEIAIAGQAAFAKVAPALDKVFDSATDVARQFPVLTTAAVGAAGALTVLAAAAGAAGLAGLLTGRGAAAGAGAAGALGKAAGLAKGAGVAGSAAFAGYEVWQLGSAVNQWWDATHREGVQLSPEARARVGGGGEWWRGRGYRDPRLLGLTAPTSGPGSTADAIAAAGNNALGTGSLDVNVRVSDDRTTATTSVARPMSLVRINPGNTNPAGY
ncbi:MAG: hypothetical protein RL375_4016 [Pseudomonadota bacterium]|jgi:hypothetical protein